MESFLIATVVIICLALIVFVIYAILYRTGIIDSWRKGKKAAAAYQYPCLLDGDCGTYFGLSRNYVCDPKLKQCRIQSYLSGSCQKDIDCLEITPHCVLSPVLTVGPMCSHTPYTHGDLFGDPSRGMPGCQSGLINNTSWHFCQYDVGGFCRTSDDCGRGACVNTTCQILGGFDPCTEGSSYGNHQCTIGEYCALDLRHPLSTKRCQPAGITPGQDGSYCKTNSDCDNKDCYFAAPGDTVGICASHLALVGMKCAKSAECAQSLECSIHSGETTGTCVLSDPAAQKDITRCPPGQYTFADQDGCRGALATVPCSQPVTCKHQCVVGDPSQLILGYLGPDQVWNLMYQDQDVPLFANAFMANLDGTISLKANTAILLSPSELTAGARENYPTITLTPVPPVSITDTKSCEPLTAKGLTLYSSYANQVTSNALFIVKYDPLNPQLAELSITLMGTIFSPQSDPVIITKNSLDLYADFYVNGDIYNAGSYDTIYVPCNYHGRDSDKPFPLSVGDQAHPPTPWNNGSGGYLPLYLVPPPTVPIMTSDPAYLDECLRFGQDSPVSVEPLQIFTHFFFFRSPGEVVISWKFQVLPTQGGGGLTTLVALFEVERDTTPPSALRTRRLVVSTLTIYAMTRDEAILTAKYAHTDPNTTMYAYRLNQILTSTTTGINIYASIYSFVLIDFENDWPFTTKLQGPDPTYSDTAGQCNVSFTSSVQGEATFDTLARSGDSIPGWSLQPNLFPVFTPRAYTHVQAATTIRTFQWTSANLFGNNTPSLLDSDMVAMAIAGRSSIIGLLLVYSQLNIATPQTLLLTMRFGDVIPANLYSRPNLDAYSAARVNPTRMYTFFLTPEPSETGGAEQDIGPFQPVYPEFPTPEVALRPVVTTDITSWVTDPALGPDGKYAFNAARTPWGSEVFTASLVPSSLFPPVRFMRFPVTSAATLAAKGGDDVWIWGRDADDRQAMKFVPLFFDNLGTTVSQYSAAHTGRQTWVSASATSCPPSVAQATAQIDHTYFLYGPDGTYNFAEDGGWDIKPGAHISDMTKLGNVQLTGRMCQTQGYQDGLLYRTRPHVFAAPGDPENLPAGVSTLLTDPNGTLVIVTDLESMALVLSSLSTPTTDVVNYKVSLPLIGVGSISALLGGTASSHPKIPNVFGPNSQREIIWVGSESDVPMLPGGYRMLACPVNPRAHTTLTTSAYPISCPDAPLIGSQTERKTLPICIIYRYTVGDPKLEMHLYDIRVPGELTSDTVVQLNGGLVTMAALPTGYPPVGLVSGYPGFNGGPVAIYTGCE